jgi:hypothetical protein
MVSMVKETEVTKAMIERRQTLAAHVEAATASGLRLSDYARREGLSVRALYQYRKREKQRARRDGEFVRVVSSPEPMLAAPVQVRFPNGVSVALALEAKALPGLLTTLARL